MNGIGGFISWEFILFVICSYMYVHNSYQDGFLESGKRSDIFVSKLGQDLDVEDEMLFQVQATEYHSYLYDSVVE